AIESEAVGVGCTPGGVRVEVGNVGAVVHVGRIATFVEVAQIAHVHHKRPATGDAAADLADHFGDVGITPDVAAIVEQVGDVAEAVGPVQGVADVDDAGVSAQPLDEQVTTGGDARVTVEQCVGLDAHVPAGVDDRVGTDAGCQHVLGDAAGGDAILLVAAKVCAAVRQDQRVVRIGIGVLGPQLHAVAGAGSVGVGVGQVVIDV